MFGAERRDHGIVTPGPSAATPSVVLGRPRRPSPRRSVSIDGVRAFADHGGFIQLPDIRKDP
ncbi:hypothetical protein BE15_02700 [Sorangium cellulosum]|uniref:Uncharacterized protein n=1 Tax=Sorangium cellulosum TaxID=56 RepID=A0A150QYI6_SORCE|nr:hypothetical protein BE15_02700 [Sorangium cellulosum]